MEFQFQFVVNVFKKCSCWKKIYKFRKRLPLEYFNSNITHSNETSIYKEKTERLVKVILPACAVAFTISDMYYIATFDSITKKTIYFTENEDFFSRYYNTSNYA